MTLMYLIMMKYAFVQNITSHEWIDKVIRKFGSIKFLVDRCNSQAIEQIQKAFVVFDSNVPISLISTDILITLLD